MHLANEEIAPFHIYFCTSELHILSAFRLTKISITKLFFVCCTFTSFYQYEAEAHFQRRGSD